MVQRGNPERIDHMDLTYWYMFPAAVLIAATANGAGVGGATFFSPLFVLVLSLDPKIAIGTALITEVFGFSSGVVAHARAKAIDWRMARTLLLTSVPAAVIGSLVSGAIDATALKLVLGVGLTAVAIAFLRHRAREREDLAIARGEGVVSPYTTRHLVTSDGHEFEYRVCRQREGRAFSGVGGLFVGLISTGLGEANSYALIERCRVPSRISVATSVVVVAVTAIAASVVHLVDFVSDGGDQLSTIANIVVFTIPGVLLGAQLGPEVVRRLDEQTLIRGLGLLFLGVAAITLVEALL